MYTSIHNHSECSNLRFEDCTIKVETLLDQAIELGYNGVCITDHEAVSGHVRFLAHYKALKDAGKVPEGFRIGLGNEIYLVDRDKVFDEEGKPQKTQFYHLVLVAKDAKGHEQLRRLSSSAWENYFRQGPAERVPTFKDDLKKIIGEDSGHLIVSTACLGGELAALGLEYARTREKTARQKIIEFLSFLIEVFGKDNVFLEMQPRMYRDGAEIHDQVTINRLILKIAKSLDLPYIVSTDTHYLTKEDRYVHEAFLKSDSTNHGDRELEDFYETTYMMSEDELKKHLMSHMSEDQAQAALDNTQKIWDKLTEYDLSHSVIVPIDKHVPTDVKLRGIFDEYSQYEYIQKFRNSEDSQERYFLHLIEEGFLEKEQEFNETNLARIDKELGTIWEISARLDQRLAHYYVLVRELIHKVMWPVSYVGVARGSVTGFYTCYLSGITQINPIEYNLPDWRHLDISRPELPDIDIDTSASKRPVIFNRMKDYYGADNVLNTLTFKTLTSKSAVLTACRGLGINDDTAHALSNYVPMERGFVWSLKDCLEGNAEQDRQPVTAFIKEINKYSHLKLRETMLGLEGLICGRSIHASSVYMYEDGFIKQNALMRAPNGTRVTAFNMTDSDVLGGLKLDALTIQNLDKMQTAMKLLTEAGIIQDQGSIKATYDKYLHPDVLEKQDPKMWEMIANNEVISLFQFDSQVGQQAGKKIKPTNIIQMAAANSLMRLMAQDGEDSPIDVYVRYKNNISLWYREMEEHGLSEAEIKVMEDHLLASYGVAAVQEEIMLLSMDKRISGFTMTEANKLRRGVAKKKKKVIEEIQALFFERCKERGTSDALAHYVWDVQIHRQCGYSFSLNHTTPYSVIGLQNLNLAYRYPLYWNTACLTVDAGADTDNDSNDVTDYGKIAKAIGDISSRGQAVALPSINRAKFDFYPDTETNEIVFSLKALRGLGDAQAEAIVTHQPFKSFEDFLERTGDVVKPAAVIALIKAGAFDELEPQRRELMRKYLATQAPTIAKLSMSHLPELIQCGAIRSDDCKFAKTCYAYLKYVKSETPVIAGETPGKTWYHVRGKQLDEVFFNTNLLPLLKYERDYKTNTDNGFTIATASALDRAIKKLTEPFKQQVLNNPAVLEKLNESRVGAYLKDKAPGTLSSWEMETMSFYHGPHELAGLDEKFYGIKNFNMLPEEPIETTVTYGDRSYSVKQMYNIAGTVIGKNKDKHTVTLLTRYGVVNLKFYRDSFVKYNQQLSVTKPDGSKQVIEKSWFSHGSKIVAHGFRNGDTFIVRQEKRKNGVDIPAVSLIQKQRGGYTTLKNYRESIDDWVEAETVETAQPEVKEELPW